MHTTVHHHIKRLIEDTNEAYSICSSGGVNADFAEFAALSLADFKTALENPNLTENELVTMLRKAITRHKSVNPRSCWATFLAGYISHKANSDKYDVVRNSWRSRA